MSDQTKSSSLHTIRTEFAVTHTLNFRDVRIPSEMRLEMERRLMVLFVPTMAHGRLCMSAHATIVGNTYAFELCFHTIVNDIQYYSLCMSTSWAASPATHHEYYRKTADSWFALYTSELAPFEPTTAISDGEPVASERYRQMCEAALHAEDHLNTVEAIQQTIVAAMKANSYFATSHKEGGSYLRYREGKFNRTDYGEAPASHNYQNEASFLVSLRQFFNSDITRHSAGAVAEIDAWRLILRILETR